MYEAYLNGDTERSLAYFHPEVELDFSMRVDTAVEGAERSARNDVSGANQALAAASGPD